MFVLQRCGLQFVVMVLFKGNGELGAHSIITALDRGKGKLALDDAPLYAAKHFGLEVNLDDHRKMFWVTGCDRVKEEGSS